MCGIIGYLGDKQATPILMDSLKRLEYRGYDSAGVAVMETDIHSTLTKSERKVDDLIAKLNADMPKGTLGIGHTRWATHGRPTIVNAHPHSDCYARIMVVHNGIIENFQELKDELEAKGHEFTSETDSEVIPHLVEDLYKGDLLTAVRQALQKIQGAYAMALYSHDDPELLIGARLNAPLVVGMGEGEWFIARREELLRMYLEALLTLGGLLFEKGDYAKAADAYRRAIAHDNYLEAAHRELMRCYTQLGEPGQAIRHYEGLVELMRAELSSPPATETTALFESLRRGEEI